MKKIRYKFLILIQLISLIFAAPVWAQDASDDILRDSMQDLSIVVGLGAGGAILGLSTLSFVEKPGDHLNNILVGASIGIIIGVAAVAYKQANKTNSGYRGAEAADFSTLDRTAWHNINFETHRSKIEAPLGFGYSFNF